MTIHGKKFESLVQLGLFLIVFVLLVLNITANYIVNKAYNDELETTGAQLRYKALAVSRVLESFDSSAADSTLLKLRREHRLRELHLFRGLLETSDEAAQLRWQQNLSKFLPEEQLEEITPKAKNRVFSKLITGSNSDAIYLLNLNSDNGRKTLLISAKADDLAYLEGARRVLLISMFVALSLIIIIYFALSRFIVSPFERIKKEAIEGGREAEVEGADVESLVAEYRLIIDELRKKESELLRLNDAVTQRADRLEQFNQYLLGSISSGIVTFDNQGRIRSINRAASEMLGIDGELLVGSSWDQLFDTDSEYATMISDCLDSKKNQVYRELEYRTVAEEDILLGVTISNIVDNYQDRIGVSLLMNDLTEINQLRSKLEIKGRLAAMGEMAAGLAHQLRNSIGAISGYGRLIKKKLTTHNLSTDELIALETELKEAEKLVGCFLDFARPLRLSPAPVKLKECISELIDGLKIRANSSNIDFVFISDYDAEVVVDWLLIKQALSNIIQNAITAYDGDKGRVEIQSSKGEDEAIVSIRDNAGGIPTDEIKRIFTPFYSTRPSGTGLGLPLAEKIISSHGGQIDVESVPGRNTVFTISLPLSPEHDPLVGKEQLAAQ